ncbi:hypothetical protein SAMN04489722_10666 [Algibacter lectus]|uniref:hypothetical protein n=1 Tax=Algibacter lectus TaxID=221126 RepID=UPI0008EB8F6E|nr:hypothetical protein [Algibacter lectus]SFD20768.1 hypothetical protein SAMN04489722_10666 [Algibacter lectus]
MDRYTYNCNYCGVEYTPRRRFKQKYCCNSCRVNAFNQRKKAKTNLLKTKKEKTPTTKDKMSWVGVGNAAVGTFATNLVTQILTKEENMPATKGDIKNLLNNGSHKTFLVKNMPPAENGSRPYFDTYRQIITYK